MLNFHFAGLEFKTAEQCEQFRMMAFSVSCATCERSDQQCPWGRDNPTIIAEPSTQAQAASAA